MSNEEWQEFVEALVETKRALAEAWTILDGADGATPQTEDALSATLKGIDTVFASERSRPENQGFTEPASIHDHWDRMGSLPGFAVGT